MTAYAFWNNKAGVGKSFLSFVAATEYAHAYPDTDVYVIDLCPQANISETLLVNPDVIHKLIGQTPRATVAGYLEARLHLSGPSRMCPPMCVVLGTLMQNFRSICF